MYFVERQKNEKGQNPRKLKKEHLQRLLVSYLDHRPHAIYSSEPTTEDNVNQDEPEREYVADNGNDNEDQNQQENVAAYETVMVRHRII